MALVHALLAVIGSLALGAAALYSLLILVAVSSWRLHRSEPPHASVPPVTVLKPLCGAEPGLYQNLRSFCDQNYPQFQIVFGLRDPQDPALAVAERLRREFPSHHIDIVVSPHLHGGNRKVSNLVNMLERADHPVLVMADSDAIVGRDYLEVVTAPLHDPAVGLVTCIYRDVPAADLWSRLGAMYINEWYIPSVLLAWFFGHEGYASGQTLCIRRDTLQAIGSLRAIACHLADDYKLGELVRAQGGRIVLSRYLPRTAHAESSFAALRRHEVRWMRTLKILRPRSFRLLFLSFSLPLALLGGSLVGTAAMLPATARASLLALVVAARLSLHLAGRGASGRHLLADLWLVPLRDLLLLWVWLQGFFTSRLSWRGTEFDVGADGIMRRPT
jgi:ceramide glucosyltransferase